MSMLLKNSAWSLMAQSGKVCTQAGLFILLARGLGTYEFGLYMAIFSISQLVYPFSGLGTHNTLVMRVSRCPRILPFYFWTPLIGTLVIGSVIALLTTVVVASLYRSPLMVAMAILLTELVAYRLIDVATHAWQAMEQLKKGAIAYLTISFYRVILALVLFILGNLSLTAWAALNLVVTMLVAIYYNIRVTREHNIGMRCFRFYPKEITRGAYFSFSGTSQAINSNIDKVVLSRLASLNDVGVYSAAFRIVQMGLLPLMAVLQATYPLYFKEGKKGLGSALKFSKRISLFLLAYGVSALIGIYVLSPVVPWLLGEQYIGSVAYMRMLAPLPLIQVLHYLLGEAMTGAGLQRFRALTQILVGLMSIVMNIALISAFGVEGAIMTVLLGEVLLFLGYLLVISVVTNSTGKRPKCICP